MTDWKHRLFDLIDCPRRLPPARRPVKIVVKADERQLMMLRRDILIGVVEVELILLCHFSHAK